MSSNESKKPTVGSKAAESHVDPHVLAGLYLDKRGRRGQRLPLRFYQGRFWLWDGARYRSISESQLRAEVTQICYEWSAGGKSPFRTTRSLVSNVMQALSGLTVVEDDQDMPLWLGKTGECCRNLLSVSNGLVDLDTLLDGKQARLLPATPDWFSTVTLPYAFDPKAQCPRWEAFLSEILEGDDERIRLLQEWFGYCLTRNTGEQKFLVLEGEGSNGKSVVCDLLAAMLGEANVSHVSLEVFGDRFQLAATLGMLANIATETGELRSVAEGQLKSFTSGDRMCFDRKNLAPLNARPTARLVLATNNRPQFSDRSSGLWRRMIPLPFNVQIPDERKDKKLPDKLKAELSGILNWAVQGEGRRKAQDGFTNPKVCAAALQEYQEEMNPARVFLSEQIEAYPSEALPSQELYKDYQDWCAANGHKHLNNPAFGKEVRRRFPKVRRIREGGGNREWIYQGIRLALDAPAPS